MSVTVEINNAQDVLEVDEGFLREVARRTLEAEEVASAQVSIALLDNATLRSLNKQYLGHDYETDVLSFLLECTGGEAATGGSSGETPAAESAVPRGRRKRIEGEVLVSAEMACRRAEKLSWPAHEELVLYLVHGLLHLVGYDDLTAAEEKVMRSRERAILGRWGLAAGAES